MPISKTPVIFCLILLFLAMIAAPIVAKDSGRCVRCGMIIADNPQWEGRMHKEGEQRIVFCSPKCLLLTNPADKDHNGIKLELKDYYSTKFIDATSAWYVGGSDIMGPMGPDLIPFADKKSAEEFLQEHHGNGLYSYTDLTGEKIKELLPMKKHHKKKQRKEHGNAAHKEHQHKQ